MPIEQCFCGADVDTGDDRDSEVAGWHAHFTEQHPQFGLTETQVRNRIERVEMLEPPGERVAALGHVEIVDVSPERVDDVLSFFDHHAFADNPNWASCYCLAHHLEGGETSPDWGKRTWQENRAELADRIRAGKTTGTLCYVDGKLAGWCNSSRREEFPHYRAGEHDDQASVAACFIVSAEHRGHGIANRLLAAAVEQAERQGLSEIEGRPHPSPDNEGAAYRGTVGLFEKAGFEKVADDESTHSAVLRRSLKP
jgi:GNAT superfamily N-acetyltransferase